MFCLEPLGELLALELSTPAVGGLSENDFILAAKVGALLQASLVHEPVRTLHTLTLHTLTHTVQGTPWTWCMTCCVHLAMWCCLGVGHAQ